MFADFYDLLIIVKKLLGYFKFLKTCFQNFKFIFKIIIKSQEHFFSVIFFLNLINYSVPGSTINFVRIMHIFNSADWRKTKKKKYHYTNRFHSSIATCIKTQTSRSHPNHYLQSRQHGTLSLFESRKRNILSVRNVSGSYIDSRVCII